MPKTLWDWPVFQIKPHCLEVKCLNFPPRSRSPGPKAERCTRDLVRGDWVYRSCPKRSHCGHGASEFKSSARPASSLKRRPSRRGSLSVRAVGQLEHVHWVRRIKNYKHRQIEATQSSRRYLNLEVKSQDTNQDYVRQFGSLVAEWLASQQEQFLDYMCLRGFS